jgi:glutamate-1-semialdehyde 2,1-aminomutase
MIHDVLAKTEQRFLRSRLMQARAHEIIPGGCHTAAKGDDQYPELAPGFIARGKGCHVWDVDGNEYIEYGMGLRAVTLGHAHPSVVAAAYEAMQGGANFTRPCEIEVRCAEAFLEMVTTAEMVKFTKDGSAATSAALKLARAHTGRDLVAICRNHPFFSSEDWFIGTTAVNAGVPQAIRELTVSFNYNDIESVERLFQQHKGRIACLIMEPCKYEPPENGFLLEVQDVCKREGALFILDEMITGFRMHNGGAQQIFGIKPDLSTWGKGLANGFALSALAGKREYMELGGLKTERPRVFLLSTTHGAETHAMAAAIECMRIYREEPVVETIRSQGEQLAARWRETTAAHGLADHVPLFGFPCNLVFGTRDANGEASQAFRSLLLQELIRRGVLAPSLVISYSHTDEDIERTIEALDGALEVYSRALTDGHEDLLVGRPSKVVYRKFN